MRPTGHSFHCRTSREIFCKCATETLPRASAQQGLCSIGMKKQMERLVFFQINDAAGFKTALKTYLPQITSTATLISPASEQPLTFVNIAFSHTGLTALGITDNLNDARFSEGMFTDAPNLGDDTSQWLPPFTGTSIHGVFVLGSDQVC